MPFIEPISGDVEHGVGGGNASINNQAFSPGGAGGWRDEHLATFANGADGWIVSEYDKRTGAIRRVEFPAGLAVAAAPRAIRQYSRTLARTLNDAAAAPNVETAANLIYAGGGHVAAWLGSSGADRGLYSTIGLRLPDAGLLAVGPAGELGYKPLYQSNGPSVVREVNGEEWTLTPGHAAALQLLGARRAVWMEGFAVVVAGLPRPSYVTDGGIWKAQAAFVAGEWWICYYSGAKGIVLHPFASSARAFPILPVGDGWHAIAAVGPNTIRIAISRTEGEGAGDIWGYDVDVTTGAAAPLPFWPGGAPRVFPFVPMAEINPAPLPRPTFTFTHPISVYPFKAEGSGRPDLFTLGTYTENPTPPAPLPPGRLLLAHDGEHDWTIPAGDLRSFDLVLWELYRVKGETLEQSIARWDRQARANLAQWPQDCGVIPMFYTQGGAPGGNPPPLWTVGEVLEGLEALDAIANLSPRIKVIAPFAYDRANGIRAYPELRQAFDDCVAAAARAGEATLNPVPGAKPIAVTITAAPLEGPAPLAVRAVATITNGPARSIAWRWRPHGDPDWRIAVVNPGTDPDHTFRLDDAGAYELQAVVEGPTSRGFSNVETATATSALRSHTKGSRVMEIDGKTVRLRGAGGRCIAPDAPGTGIWGTLDGKPSQWRGVRYVDEHDPAAQYKAAKIAGDRYTFTNASASCLAGADAGQYSAGLDRQGYHKPTGDTDAGDLEQWRVYEGNENGAIEAQVEQTTDDQHVDGAGRKFFGFPLAVEVLS